MTAPAPARVRAEGVALALFDRALTRAAAGGQVTLALQDDLGRPHPVEPARWCRPHLAGDTGLLARSSGPALDVGCGPGRLTRALTRLGRPALGIDVSPAAIRLARRAGVMALRRDVFAPLPGAGRWRTILLADGNIGIGGDPAALLRRCRELLAADGRLQVEVAAPGTRTWAGDAVLTAGDTWAPLPWAVVAVGDLPGLAGPAGLRVQTSWTEAGRWFTTLTRG